MKRIHLVFEERVFNKLKVKKDKLGVKWEDFFLNAVELKGGEKDGN